MSTIVVKGGDWPGSVSATGGIGGASSRIPIPKGLSYIDDEEVALAKALIDSEFIKNTKKPFGMRVAGYYIACKIYTRPEEMAVIDMPDGTKQTLWHAPKARDGDKYQSCSALVCGVGPQAFTGWDGHGHMRFPQGPACRVGDWIAIPRQQSFMVNYRAIPMALIPDDMVLAVIEDPTDVTPINQASLI